MGSSLGKSASYDYHTSARPNRYGLPPRRRTVPNEKGNHFIKEYWERTPGGPISSGRPAGTEFWMIESEKQYRQEVFNRTAENVYRQSPSSYRHADQFSGSFDVISPFSSSTSSSSRTSPTSAPSLPSRTPFSTNSACGHSLYGRSGGANSSNANKYIPQLGIGI